MVRINEGITLIPQKSSDMSDKTQASAKAAAKQPQGPAIDVWETVSIAHGCPGCPHPAVGHAVQDAPDILVNSNPATRMKNNIE